MNWQEAVQLAVLEFSQLEAGVARNCCALASRYLELMTGRDYMSGYEINSEEDLDKILADEDLVNLISKEIGDPADGDPSPGDVVAVGVGDMISAGVCSDGFVLCSHPEHGLWRAPLRNVVTRWECPRQ